MSRFDLNLGDVATERKLVPAGVYEARISKSEIRKGTTDKGAWANLSLTLSINDPEVCQALNQDVAKVFWSGMFSFDDAGQFLKDNCPEIGVFIKVTGFTDIEDFLEGTEEIEDDREAMLKVFDNMGQASIGTDLMCVVVQKPHYQDIDRMVNEVSKIAPLAEEEDED